MNNSLSLANGFSVIELMTALTIAVLFISMAAPAFRTLLENNRRVTQVNEFVTALSLARSEALKRGNNVTLCRTTNSHAPTPSCGKGNGWEDGWIVFDDQNANGEPDDADDIIRRRAGFSNTHTTLRGNTNISTRIAFSGTGKMFGASNGTLTWCDHRGAGPDARTIIIARTGRHQVRKEGDPGVNISCPA